MKALFKAVDSGDLNRLKQFAVDQVLSARDAESCTALHRAARNGQTSVCEYLIKDLKFDVNEIATRAKTPLYEATTHGHVQCAETLIELGASIEKSKYNEWNPLHVASSKGYTRLVSLLLDKLSALHKEEAIEARNKEGSTALSLACRGGYVETVRELLKVGANPNTKNHNHRVPLLSACAAGSLDTVRTLIEEGKCSLSIDDVVDKSGATPLHEAATSDSGRETIDWFLTSSPTITNKAAGKWITLPDQAGRLPVHIAALNGQAESFRALLFHEVGLETLESKDSSGASPLFLACVRGHPSVVQVGLQFHANEEAQDASGRSCFEVAKAWKRETVVNILERRTFLLQDGQIIPGLGLGTYKLNDSTYSAVSYALSTGKYHMLDMAEFYGNESEVGRAIHDSSVERKNLFLISKIWNNNISSGNVEQALHDILKRLDISYLDMVLIHWPCKGFEDAYGQLIDCRQRGLIRYVGVSNFYPEHIDAIFQRFHEYPALNQIELSAYFHRTKLIDYCLRHGILVQCYRSLGHEGFVGKSRQSSDTEGKASDVVERIASVHSKTRSQVLLRWCLQKNVIVIPKSVHASRIEENAELFDFKLTVSEMKELDSLNIPGIEEQWLDTVFKPSSTKDVVRLHD